MTSVSTCALSFVVDKLPNVHIAIHEDGLAKTGFVALRISSAFIHTKLPNRKKVVQVAMFEHHWWIVTPISHLSNSSHHENVNALLAFHAVHNCLVHLRLGFLLFFLFFIGLSFRSAGSSLLGGFFVSKQQVICSSHNLLRQ